MNTFIQGFLKQAGQRPAFDEEKYIDRIENREVLMDKVKPDTLLKSQLRGGVMPMKREYKSQPFIKSQWVR